jgi:hypothetical protein
MYCMDSAEDPEPQPAGQRETSEPERLVAA